MSGEPGERDIGDNYYVNETEDSDVAGLSHLDAPSESVYIVCGVLIAMVLVAGIIILLAVFISKLRKRDSDNNRHNAVHHRHTQDRVILQSTPTVQQQNNVNNNHHLHNNNNNNNNNGTPPPTVANGATTIPTVSSTVVYPPPILQTIPSATETTPANGPRQFIWQIPATQAYALYSNDKETLVHPLPSEQPGFCRGFRKNLQGRWKRLVKRKPMNETYAIPPELRDQLKNIYVY